jgi:hypothetical protein
LGTDAGRGGIAAAADGRCCCCGPAAGGHAGVAAAGRGVGAAVADARGADPDGRGAAAGSGGDVLGVLSRLPAPHVRQHAKDAWGDRRRGRPRAHRPDVSKSMARSTSPSVRRNASYAMRDTKPMSTSCATLASRSLDPALTAGRRRPG